MANVDKAFGFRLARNLGSMTTPAIECVALATYATNLFVGDLVLNAAAGDTDGRVGVTQAVGSEGTPSTNIFGLIVGFRATGPDDNSHYRGTASTLRYPLVVPLTPYIELIAQADGGMAASAGDFGAGADIVVGAGSTTTGASGMEIDISSATTSGQLRILGLERSPDNEVDTAAAGTNLRVVVAEGYLTQPGAAI